LLFCHTVKVKAEHRGGGGAADARQRVLAREQAVRDEEKAPRPGGREAGAHQVQTPGVGAEAEHVAPHVAEQHE
jgi:hypothetical protein